MNNGASLEHLHPRQPELDMFSLLTGMPWRWTLLSESAELLIPLPSSLWPKMRSSHVSELVATESGIAHGAVAPPIMPPWFVSSFGASKNYVFSHLCSLARSSILCPCVFKRNDCIWGGRILIYLFEVWKKRANGLTLPHWSCCVWFSSSH